MDIRYHLSFPHPSSHIARVRIDVKGFPADFIDFALPSWVPGSYKIRDFARHVQDFRAGKHEWKKTAKNRWRVVNAGSRDVSITYDVFCFEPSVQASHVDDTHAFVSPGSVLMCVDGYMDTPATLVVRRPRGWKTATGLEPVAGKRDTFAAPDYDVLVDSPIEVGRFKEWKFRVRKVPHRVVMHGDGNYDEKRLMRDVKKICEVEARMMRHIPYRHYTFIVHTTHQRGGGLEHLNSTALQYPRFGFRPQEKYENWLELVAHEFFHLWNVKRIRPEMLGPFDYEKEVYTSLLWVMEGITSYYDALFPTRAKIVPPDRYFRKIAERIQKMEERPGRLRQSLAASSFDTWIKLYQPNENAVNAIMSYYQKGELVGIPLDLEIRRATRNRGSLDDVMRLLYREWAREGRGFPEPVFQETVERVAGRSFQRFFDAYVHGTEDVDWNRYLDAAGVRLVKKPVKDGGRSEGYLGVHTQKQHGRVIVAGVLEGTAAWKDGLSARDELLAIDGYRIDPENWQRRISERSPGARLEFTVVRDGRLVRVPVRLGRSPGRKYRIQRVKKPRELQKKVYESWLGNRWKKD